MKLFNSETFHSILLTNRHTADVLLSSLSGFSFYTNIQEKLIKFLFNEIYHHKLLKKTVSILYAVSNTMSFYFIFFITSG